MRSPLLLIAVLFLVCTSLVACDSNDNKLSDESLEEFTRMMSNTFGVFSLLSIELAPASTSEKANRPKDIYECPQGGQVDFNATNVGGENNTVTYALDLDDCNGLNGSLEYEIGGEFNQDVISLDITIDGNVTESCSVTFSQFNEKISADLTTGPTAIEFTLNGRIASTCGNESFACIFDADIFDTSNTSFFEDRCILN